MKKSIYDMRIDRITDLKIELQKAKQELSDAEKALADFDNDLAKSKDILHDAYSDSELSHLVSTGEFPADKVDEYKEAKRMLLKYIACAPTAREPFVQARDTAREKVSSIQSQFDIETDAFNASIFKPKINAKTVFQVVISIAVLAGIISCLVMALRGSISGKG